MTTYTIQAPPHAGAAVTLTAPGGTAGDLAPTGQGWGLMVVNNGGTAVTVTLPINPLYDNLAIGSRVVTVPAISGAVPGISIIPLPPSVYGTAATGVQYSVVGQVTVAMIRIP
jgi:hypothetical protein